METTKPLNLTPTTHPQPLDQMVTMQLTPHEAALIMKLRRYSFGQFEIHKIDGNPVRMVVKENQLINPQDGIAMTREQL